MTDLSAPQTTDTPRAIKSGLHRGQIAVGVLSAVLALAGFIGIATIWVMRQLFIIEELPQITPIWTALSYIGLWGVLAGVIMVARRLIKAARYKTVLTLWLWATLSLLIFLPLRFFNYTTAQWTAVAQVVLGLMVWLLLRTQQSNRTTQSATYAIAITCAALLSLPWLLNGAFGSLLDVLLNGMVGIVLALIARDLILTKLDFAVFGSTTRQRDIALLALAIGGTLRLLALGLGVNGQQLILVIALPALGWLIATLGYTRLADQVNLNLKAPTLLLAIISAVILVTFDGDELFLMLTGTATNEALPLAMRAAAITAGLALALAAIGSLFKKFSPITLPQKAKLCLAAGAGLIAFGAYFFGGQPGFHGEQLFVVMADQADLSTIANFENFETKRETTYKELTKFAVADQAELRTFLERWRIDYQPYYLINAIQVPASPFMRLYLSRHPDVDRVLENPYLRPLPDILNRADGIHSRPTEIPWNLHMIDAPRVWDELGVTGSGVIIGQSDSGAEWEHPELINSYRQNPLNNLAGATYVVQPTKHDYAWLDPWRQSIAPYDQGGHGTHTLGTIVGETVGVAPGAEWFACSNLYRNLANPALYLDCMQFMLAPYPYSGNPFTDGRPNLGAHVINNSWGCPEIEGCDADSLLVGTQALRHAGIFIVTSAGNEGPNCETISSPLAIYDESFSVGAVDWEQNTTGFSSRGPVTVDGSNRIKPDIMAPGKDIISAAPGGTYAVHEGTSMAGPHVAGVVALMYSANPALIGEIDTVEQLIIDTATPLTGNISDPGCNAISVPNNTTGHGLINAYAAVEAAIEWQP